MTVLASAHGRDLAPRNDPPGVDAMLASPPGEASQPEVSNEAVDGGDVHQVGKSRFFTDDKRLQASLELDEEIASVQKLYESANHPHANEEDTFAGTTSGASAASKKAATQASDGDVKLVEELKVVRHLTRPIHSSMDSSRTGKSKKSKRKHHRKRGDSLERDISKTILQTASAGATQAHFLVENRSQDETLSKSAQFILSDLFEDTETSKSMKEEDLKKDVYGGTPLNGIRPPANSDEPDVPDASHMSPDPEVSSTYSQSLFNEKHLGSISTPEIVEEETQVSNDPNGCSSDVARAAEQSYVSGYSTPESAKEVKEAEESGSSEDKSKPEKSEIPAGSIEDDPFQGLESDDSFSWREIAAASTSKSFEGMEAIPEEKRAKYNAVATRRIRAQSEKRRSETSPVVYKLSKEDPPEGTQEAPNLEKDPSLKDLSFGSSLSTETSELKTKEIAVTRVISPEQHEEKPGADAQQGMDQPVSDGADPFGTTDVKQAVDLFGTGDDWTEFQSTPFYVHTPSKPTPKDSPQPAKKTPKMKPIQPPKKASPRRATEILKQQSAAAKVVQQQPRSPASVYEFQPTATNNNGWNLDLPRNDAREMGNQRISI